MPKIQVYPLESCPDCGGPGAVISCAESTDPVNFPGTYDTVTCPSCEYYEFFYCPAPGAPLKG